MAGAVYDEAAGGHGGGGGVSGGVCGGAAGVEYVAGWAQVEGKNEWDFFWYGYMQTAFRVTVEAGDDDGMLV